MPDPAPRPLPEPPASPAGTAGATDVVAQLVAQQGSLKAALEIAHAILAGREPESMWGAIAHRARRLVEADVATVRTPSLDGRTLVLRGVDRRRPGDRLSGLLLHEELIADRICRPVFETGRARLVGDLPAGPAVAVALSAGGRAFGALLAVGGPDRPPFRRHHVDLLRLFAGQTALAIHHAEARRELQRLSVIEERDRLARELHGSAIQALYGITLDLASAAAQTGDPVLRERMARLVGTVDDVIQDLRNQVYGLRPSVLAGRRLDTALRQLARDFEWQSGIRTVARVEARAADRLSGEADDVVQIVREALSNVGRHARARSCRVDLALHGSEARLVVLDDGVGFDPGQVEAGGHGLRNFADRVARLGGRLEILSSPNEGTELRIEIPLRLPLARPLRQDRRPQTAERRRVLEGLR